MVDKEEQNENKMAISSFNKSLQQSSGRNDSQFVMKILGEGEDDSFQYIACELCRLGDLEQFIKEQGRLTIKEARKLLYHCAMGLHFLHTHDMLHRDIKPANIFISNNYIYKIGDYGLMKFNSKDVKLSDKMVMTAVGSPYYKSISFLKGEACNSTIDIFALGITIYEALHGLLEFPWPTDQKDKKKIKNEWQLATYYDKILA